MSDSKEKAKIVDQVKNELGLAELVLNNCPVAGGVISVAQDKNFQVPKGNKHFYEIASLGKSQKPLPLDKAFSFLNNFNPDLINSFAKQDKQKSIDVLVHSDFASYKFHLIKATPYVVYFLEDISPVLALKEELLEKKKQLKESQKIAHLGYWIQSHNEGNHFWSEEVFSILGAKPSETAPSFNNYLTFVHPFDKEAVSNTYNEALKNKSGYELTHRILSKNNAVKFVTQRCYTDYNENGEPLQTVGIIHDITGIEQTKQHLLESEEKFRSVFNHAPIAIVLVNQSVQPMLSNNQFCQITGYSMDEVNEKGLSDFTHPDDLENNKELYEQLFKNEIDNFTITKRYLKKDKTVIWVKATVSAVKNQRNKVAIAIAMIQDITAEKNATRELIKSEYKYRTLIENANDGIGLFDMNFKPIIYNTALYRMLGYELDEYLKIDHNKFELFHPDDVADAQKALENIKNREKTKIEKRLRNKEGNYQYFSINYIPVLHEEKPAILIFRRDISKRKYAEQQNEEYRLFLETLMDNLPVSLFAKTTPDFRYLYWNRALERLTGLPAEEALGKTDHEIIRYKKIADQYLSEDQQILKRKTKLESEHDFTNTLGENKQFKTIKTLHHSTIGNPIILGISMDITKLKEAEKQIEQSTQMLKEAQKIAKLGYWEYDVEKDLFFDNIENRQILGTEKLSYFINAEQFFNLVAEPDKEVVKTTFFKCIKHQINGEGIIRIINNDSVRHVSINYRPVTENNKVIKLRGTCLDITRIRKSELALRESETRLKQAEHIAKMGYWNHDYANNETHFSDEVWNILEKPKSNQPIEFIDFINFIHPDDKQDVALLFNRSRLKRQPFDFDFRIKSNSGKIKYIKSKGTFVKNQKDEVAKAIGTFQDITELKEKEIELSKTTLHLQQIQRLSKTGYLEVDLNTQKTYFSDSIKKIIEVKKDNLTSQEDFDKLIHPNDKKTILKTLKKAFNDKLGHNIQYRLLLPSGNLKFVNEICSFQDNTGQPGEFATRIIQDITHIKEKEIELSKSETQLNQMAKEVLIGTWEYNTSTGKYHLSDEIKDILNINKQKNQYNFREILKLIHPDDYYSVKKVITSSINKKENYKLTYRVILPDTNEVRYIKDTGRILKTPQGDWGIFSVLRDITEIKLTRKKLSNINQLYQTITENFFFGTFIYQNGKHIYVNKKWCNLTGLIENEVIDKAMIGDVYKEETAKTFYEIFNKWEDYNLSQYTNKIDIEPKNAPGFKAEIFIKEIRYNEKPAFMGLIYHVD